VSNANNHVKKAKNALKGMAAGGKKNANVAKQVNGNLTLAMNALAAANSTADKAAQKQLNQAMQMMASMMAVGNAAASSCAGA